MLKTKISKNKHSCELFCYCSTALRYFVLLHPLDYFPFPYRTFPIVAYSRHCWTTDEKYDNQA